jgi:nickel/cobalt exporter
MTGFTIALLGLGLGIRHATDVDHLVVVAGLVQRERGVTAAARVAALWGLGHSVSFLAIGTALVALGVVPPAGFDTAAEALVGVMLLGFGVWHAFPHAVASTPQTARPIAVGVVHGLAGSAVVSLLALTTIDSRPVALLYLLLVGVGTLVGMVLATLALSWPLRWSVSSSSPTAVDRRRLPRLGAAALSIGLGVLTLAELFFPEGS